MLRGDYAFVDIETTGCNPVRDRITEVAIVSVRDGQVTERWQSLVDPGVPIPESIQALRGSRASSGSRKTSSNASTASPSWRTTPASITASCAMR
jgi:hypothetical protein